MVAEGIYFISSMKSLFRGTGREGDPLARPFGGGGAEREFQRTLCARRLDEWYVYYVFSLLALWDNTKYILKQEMLWVLGLSHQEIFQNTPYLVYHVSHTQWQCRW